MAPAASEAIELLRRVNEAVWILLQTTVDTFVADYTATIVNHASRLEGFNRMVSHELRQPLGTLTYAMPLLKAASERGDVAKQTHLLGVMERNVASLLDMLQKLELVSRVQTAPSDTPAVQHVELSSIAGQVKRQLREMADARGVEILVREGLPSVTIDVARLELILVNLLSNGIKYTDPAKPDRFVAIEAGESADPGFCAVAVRDNGLGIPPEKLTSVFKRFVRAHAERDHELGVRGSGLGLSIVEECLDAIGARIAIDSTVGDGTSVLVTLPDEPPTRVSTFDVPETENPD
jgi:signal transduction histidine kinase